MPARNDQKAITFDAYGTLFDVYSVGALAEELFPGMGGRLAAVWRTAQIDYTRIRTLSDRYCDFWEITGDALLFAARSLGLELTPGRRDALMDQYARLAAFPEAPGVLRDLKTKGFALAILSNGSGPMLSSAIASAGMEGLFTHVLSVDQVQKYKTAPEAYQLAPDAFLRPAAEVIFVSSNSWDICGATWFGFRTFWINRAANPLDVLGIAPHGEGRTLADLAAFVTNEHPAAGAL